MFERYQKFFVAVIGAAITWALAEFPNNEDVQTWASLAAAIITAIGVYAVPNRPSA